MSGSGLKLMKVKPDKDLSFKSTLIDQLNILWLFLKYVRENSLLGWNGFILTSSQDNYQVSVMNFLPFINASPSNYITLYTALNMASKIVLIRRYTSKHAILWNQRFLMKF